MKKPKAENSTIQFALMDDGSVIIHQKFPNGQCTFVEIGSVDAMTPVIDGLTNFQKRCRAHQ